MSNKNSRKSKDLMELYKSVKGRQSPKHKERVVPSKKKKHGMTIEMDGFNRFGTGSGSGGDGE